MVCHEPEQGLGSSRRRARRFHRANGRLRSRGLACGQVIVAGAGLVGQHPQDQMAVLQQEEQVAVAEQAQEGQAVISLLQ